MLALSSHAHKNNLTNKNTPGIIAGQELDTRPSQIDTENYPSQSWSNLTRGSELKPGVNLRSEFLNARI